MSDPRAKAYGDSRRTFLVKTGAAAGGLVAMSKTAILAQTHGPGALARAGESAHAAAAMMQGESQAPPFDFGGVTMPRRKSFYDWSPDEVAQLVKAYGRMKALPSNDPRAWLNQANIHAAHCGGSWMEVHFSWWFTVWHRCYVFFYERILANFTDNPASFALPYWDWMNHPAVPNTRSNEQQGQPSPVFDQSSPLFDANRFPGPNTTFSSDPNSSNAALYCSADFLNNELLVETDFTSFCGGDPNVGGSAGDLEQFPHNNVHIWTGINAPPQNGQDMDDLSTAARDILFFMHHANVDRMFTLWLAKNNPLPPAGSPWYSQWFNFWDEKGNPVSVTVNDALRLMAGNYQPPQQSFTLVAEAQTVSLGGPSKTFENVAVPETLQKTLTGTVEAQAAPVAPKRSPTVRLRLEGIEAPHDVPVILHVFINKKDATVKDVNGPSFAGTLTMLPSSAAHGKAHRPVDLSIPIGRKFASLLKEQKRVSVTVVPVLPGGVRAEAAAPTVRWKRIAVVTKE